MIGFRCQPSRWPKKRPAAASFDRGVLRISVPKVEESKAKKIEIKS
jgi:HSP20 family molecular chaperone IbpA